MPILYLDAEASSSIFKHCVKIKEKSPQDVAVQACKQAPQELQQLLRLY